MRVRRYRPLAPAAGQALTGKPAQAGVPGPSVWQEQAVARCVPRVQEREPALRGQLGQGLELRQSSPEVQCVPRASPAGGFRVGAVFQL